MSIVIEDKDLPAELSKALKAAKDGQEITITSGNVPFAKLVPVAVLTRRRKPGGMPGLLSVPDDFYAPLSGDELAAWE